MNKHAVLVGINDYQFLGQLKYARQDALSVAKALQQCYGFTDNEITLMTDSEQRLRPTDKYAIEDILTPECVGTNLDLFIFGFWGHGIWVSPNDTASPDAAFSSCKRYLCPINQREDRITELGVSLDEIQSRLSAIGAKNVCLILDCCQSVSAGRDAVSPVVSDAEMATVPLIARDICLKTQQVKGPDFTPTVAILNACSQGQRAYEWARRGHGIFTGHLLDALRKPVKRISELFETIKPEIEQTAHQQNVSQTPYYFCQGGADIVLPAVTQPTPTPSGPTIAPLPRRIEPIIVAQEVPTWKYSAHSRAERFSWADAMDSDLAQIFKFLGKMFFTFFGVLFMSVIFGAIGAFWGGLGLLIGLLVGWIIGGVVGYLFGSALGQNFGAMLSKFSYHVRKIFKIE